MRALVFAFLLAAPAFSQLDRIGETLGQIGKKVVVAEVKLRSEPEGASVRPLETLILQVRAYGKVDEQVVRLQRTGAKASVQENGGWVSKAFVYQGKDEEKFYDESSKSVVNILRKGTGEYVNKDSFLYTAPAAEGRYKVDVELEGQRASIEISVTASAPSNSKAEKKSFGAEASGSDPYRKLAEHWAPFLAQETWWQPKSDMIARFDYDGDWNGANNWDNLAGGSSQAYVHYAAVETATHWFLIYNIFHPRDYSDKCAVGTCHENDNEGLILSVFKDGSEFGRLQAMETLAHNNVYSFVADRSLKSGAHNIDGPVELHDLTHPVVFIESGGHGIYGSRSTHSKFDFARQRFLDSTGITYVYKGVAERPKHANDRMVGYELLPILDQWWTKARQGAWNEKTFDDYFQYQPLGGRPGIAFAVGGTFYGRKEASNKAKPFWGWHDGATLKKQILAPGQWGLDPAYAVSRNLSFPAPFSMDYLYNPYLEIGEAQKRAEQAPLLPQIEPPEAVGPQFASQGTIDIEIRVDGVVEMQIAWDKVHVQVIQGQPPGEPKTAFSAPLPPVAIVNMQVKKISGRGTVKLKQKGDAANEHTTVVSIEDPKSGADSYKVQLTWSRQ